MTEQLKTNAFFRGFTDKSLTAMIAVGFLEHNPMPATDVPGFIGQIHAALAALPADADIVVDRIGAAAAAQTATGATATGTAAADLPGGTAADPFQAGSTGGPVEGATETPQFDGSEHKTPAEIKKSITANGLISFIDGKPYQTIKRHLTKHGMTPETYRARFGLPDDYPMTAPAYAEERRQLAIRQGLGGGRTQEAAPTPAPEAPKRGANTRRGAAAPTPAPAADKGRSRRSGTARAAHAAS